MSRAVSLADNDANAAELRAFRRGRRYAMLAALLFVAVMAGAMALTEDGAIVEHLGRLDPLMIIVLLALSTVNFITRGVRWQVFSIRLGMHVPWSAMMLYFVAGFSLTATPGKVGEAMRLWLMKRGHDCDYEKSVLVLVADRIGDLAAVLILCILGAGAFQGVGWGMALASLITVVMLVLLLRPQIAIRIGEIAFALFRRQPRLFARYRRMLRRASNLASVPVFGGTLLIVMLGWFAQAYAFWLLLGALGAEVPLASAIFIYGFSLVVGALSMLPGGLGGTEATMIGLLGLLGVDLDTAVAATAIIRIITLWFAVGVGLVAMPFAIRRATAQAVPAGAELATSR